MKGMGPVMLAWLVMFGILLLLPFGFIAFKPEVKFILAAVMIISIYNFLRGFFGDSWITLGLTALFTYLFIYKHFWESLAFWWFWTLLGFGVFTFLGWLYIGVMQVVKRR